MDYGTGSGPGGIGGSGMQTRGFFSSLFDISFRSFVTARIIGILYVISIALIVLTAIVYIVVAFTQSATLGALTLLIFAPLGSILSIIYVRVLLELAIVLFRIAENTGEMVRQGRQ